MAKTAMVTARIDSNLKVKAKEQNINLSDAIEQTLKSKTQDTTKSTLILVVEKYGISLIPNNWVVGRLSNTPQVQIEDVRAVKVNIFDQDTQTYHPSLHQALIELSKRLFEDKLKVACIDKTLELKQLAQMIKDHHAYFVGIVEGM